jgi:hypothetical protein
MADTLRKLKIKTGATRRTLREISLYEQVSEKTKK